MHIDTGVDDNPNITIASNCIVWCFKDLNTNTFKKSKDADFFKGFLTQLQLLSTYKVADLFKPNQGGKHTKIGCEYIPISIIKPQLPSGVTPDIKKLAVFRACGNNRPFLGILVGNVFKILFIESKFGEIYDH